MINEDLDDVSEGLLLAINQARAEVEGNGDSRVNLRIKLFEYMCQCAEEISSDEYKRAQYKMLGVKFSGKWPKCFRPGVFEKKIFQDIISSNLSEIVENINEVDFPYLRKVAVRLMCSCYYPDYASVNQS